MTEYQPMPYGPEDIGVFLLESITTGLYRMPLTAIREYIQNEIDADPAPELIEIQVKKEARKLSIIGDGGGMDEKELFLAKKVGLSEKDRRHHAGFRGIGIWAGVSVCSEMLVTTKKKGAAKFLVLRVDCDGLRKDVKEGTKTLLDALKMHVSYGEFDAPAKFTNKRGTHVELNGILAEAQQLLEVDQVKEYVSQVCPVEISPKCSLRNEITELLTDCVSDYKSFTIRVNGKDVFRPPTLKSSELELLGPYEFVFPTGAKDPRAFAWICQNKRPGVIGDESNKRIVFKVKGITIGDRDTILRYVRRARPLLDRTIGEVHVMDPDLIPNTERSDFEANPARDEFEKWVRDLVYQEIKTRTRAHSATEKYKEHVDLADQLMAKEPKTLIDESAWSQHIASLERATDLLNADTSNPYLSQSSRGRALKLKDRVEKKTVAVMRQYRSWEKVPQTTDSEGAEEAPEPPAAPEASEEATQEEVADEEEETFSLAPNEQLVKETQPLIEGVATRTGLDQDDTRIIEAVVRVLTGYPDSTYGSIHEFLARLELELSAA